MLDTKGEKVCMLLECTLTFFSLLLCCNENEDKCETSFKKIFFFFLN